ncbi:type III pantothenate kinase [Parendozoicomonas sp. Alg238-R29]|uniref:type III pantothenate kinase n=1 Tax=Parendozoicomonas sp. Alg238-R29 TaxID=2993446 RepID=UPI00248EA53F|nr:type III pantothenate kinase [Parendozoicomonas sp. Alg238-R29]
MNTLDIDAGNTRLKWRWQMSGQEPKYGAVINQPAEVMVEALHKFVGDSVVDVCRLSSVRSREVVDEVCQKVLGAFSVQPRLPDPASGIGGVIVNEVDPLRLGLDRWLAMLAAKGLYPSRAVMIVDAGTALTLDIVGADGVFQGGFICPGLSTMLRAMTESTDLLVMPEVPEFRRMPAFPSIQAIQNGALSMAAAFVEREFERFDGDICVILCGGDAALLAENLGIPVDYRPELVFDGLAIALPAEDL